MKIFTAIKDGKKVNVWIISAHCFYPDGCHLALIKLDDGQEYSYGVVETFLFNDRVCRWEGDFPEFFRSYKEAMEEYKSRL